MSRNRSQGTCRLCLAYKPLCDSHIIPKGFYKFLYPKTEKSDRRVPLKLYTKDLPHAERIPKGVYEKLLCESCEQHLSVLEQYAQKIILKPSFSAHPGHENLLLVQDVDCSRLRWFFISLLWRASIASHHSFAGISVGPAYEEDARVQLLSLSGHDTRFEVVLGKYNSGPDMEEVATKNMRAPHRRRIEGINFAQFYLPNAFVVVIKVDKRCVPSYLRNLQMNPENSSLLILELGDFENSDHFKSLVDNVSTHEE